MLQLKFQGIFLSRFFKDWATARQRAAMAGSLVLLFGLLLAMPARCPAAEAQAPDRYANSKYEYSIKYPSSFSPQGEADAGDGQVFLAPDGQGEMRVYAGYNVFGTSIGKRYQESLEAVGKKPTYSVLRPDWFVVSGLKDGKIYYEKTQLRRDAYFTVSFTYDPAARELFDPLIGDILKSWKIQ